jgi:hypothetical protein
MTRRRGELTDMEEELLGIERPSIAEEEETERKADEKREFRRLFLVHLMADPLFREWLMELLVEFKAFDNPFGVSPAGFPDPLATQFALGMKAAGWRLWEIFDAVAPEMASLMRRESVKG